MADEDTTMTTVDAPAAEAAPDALKKQRKPRAKKNVAETASAEVAAASAPEKPRRGRKPKSDASASSAERTPVKRTATARPTPSAQPTVALDEMADLLQLEEENQRLRRLLAEKLRAENADLKKRLKLD